MRKLLTLILLALPLGLPLAAQYNGNATRIMGRAIKGGAPSDGNAIVWDDTAKQWKYAAASGGGGTTIAGDVTGTLAAATVVKIQGLAVKAGMSCSNLMSFLWITGSTDIECTFVTEGGFSLTNVTTNNATTSAHGFAPKGTAGTAQFWRQDWTLGTPAGTAATHSFVCTIGTATGSTALTTGDTGCYGDTGSLSGAINAVSMTGNGAALAACSITVDIWKANAAYPTSGNKISASAPASLSAATTNDAGSVGTWTTAVAAHDRWGATVASVTGCVYAQVRVEFQ